MRVRITFDKSEILLSRRELQLAIEFHKHVNLEEDSKISTAFLEPVVQWLDKLPIENDLNGHCFVAKCLDDLALTQVRSLVYKWDEHNLQFERIDY